MPVIALPEPAVDWATMGTPSAVAVPVTFTGSPRRMTVLSPAAAAYTCAPSLYGPLLAPRIGLKPKGALALAMLKNLLSGDGSRHPHKPRSRPASLRHRHLVR